MTESPADTAARARILAESLEALKHDRETETNVVHVQFTAKDNAQPQDDYVPPATDPRESPKAPINLPPLLDAEAFIRTFTNPAYLIDGIIQRGRLFALTSPTGHGKTAIALYMACMIAMGRNIGSIDVTQGDVLFLAGENPDDLCARVIAACRFYDIRQDELPITFMPGCFPLDADAVAALKEKIDATGKRFACIVTDSSAAYFPGNDENQNVQMGEHARTLRILTSCRGNPAVIALCHPIKNPSKDNLLPRGGGAFLAEIDANLTLWADGGPGQPPSLHWSGKIRGVDFQPVTFALHQVALEDHKDAKGRPFISVIATLQTAEQGELANRQAVTDENAILTILRDTPGISVREIARTLGWLNERGQPQTGKISRRLDTLKNLKLVKNWRGKWEITVAGKAELRGEKHP